MNNKCNWKVWILIIFVILLNVTSEATEQCLEKRGDDQSSQKSAIGIESLPNELHEEILALLPVREFGKAAFVCQNWAEIIKSWSENKIILIDTSGAGKGTLIYPLLGQSLISTGAILKATNEIRDIVIGHGFDQGTFQVTPLWDRKHRRIIFDTPPIYEKQFPFFKSRVFAERLVPSLLIGNVKLIYLSAFLGLLDDMRPFIESLNNLSHYFSDKKQLQSNLWLVISAFPGAIGHDPSFSLQDWLSHNLIEHAPPTLSHQGLELLKFLLSENRILTFSRPDKEGVYEVDESLNAILKP